MNTPQLVGAKRANAIQGMGLGVSMGARISMGISMGIFVFILMSLWTSQPALAQNPKVDLLVELRQIEEGSTGA